MTKQAMRDEIERLQWKVSCANTTERALNAKINWLEYQLELIDPRGVMREKLFDELWGTKEEMLARAVR